MHKKYILKIILVVIITVLTGCSNKPSDDTTKNIAIQYGKGMFNLSDIDIIKSYEKDGKTVMILQINKAVCEIPMIEIKGNWTGTGFSCQGTPYKIQDVVSKLLDNKDEEKMMQKLYKTKQTKEDSKPLSDIGVLYPLDTFTAKLKSDQGYHYLKATFSLELTDEELTTELDNKSAVIRDRIIRILSSKTFEQVSSKKGKQKLSNKIKDTINRMINYGSVKSIYITEFVVQ